MRLIAFLFSFIALNFALTFATPVLAQVKTVETLNLQRYLGDWYEIARFPVIFQRGCVNSKASYSKIDAKTISVVNVCERNGKLSSVAGDAIISAPGKLRVSFSKMMPFRANYWVLWVDKTYQTAVVGEPGRRAGWILSRNPNRSKASLKKAVSVFEANGYKTDRLIWSR